MGSVDISTVKAEFPDKTDKETAALFAKKYGYVAIVRYKNTGSDEYNNFGCCHTGAEIENYLNSPHCVDAEVVYDDRVKEGDSSEEKEINKIHGNFDFVVLLQQSNKEEMDKSYNNFMEAVSKTDFLPYFQYSKVQLDGANIVMGNGGRVFNIVLFMKRDDFNSILNSLIVPFVEDICPLGAKSEWSMNEWNTHGSLSKIVGLQDSKKG